MTKNQTCELILSNLMKSKHLADEFSPYFDVDRNRPYSKLGYWEWRPLPHQCITMDVTPNMWCVYIIKFGKTVASFQWDTLTQKFKDVQIPKNFGRGLLYTLGISVKKTKIEKIRQHVRILWKSVKRFI